MSSLIERRRFNSLLAQISVGAYAATQNRSLFSAEITQDRLQPNITSGVSSGDVTHTAATIWSRADRAAKMIVELSGNENFKNSRRIIGPDAFEHSDFTAKLRLYGLKPGEPVFYRVTFQDLNDPTKMSAPVA